MGIRSLNKRGGVVGDLINGTGGLIIGVIIVLVIVSTLLGANLLRQNSTQSTGYDASITVNGSSDISILSMFDSTINRGFAAVTLYNHSSASADEINADNYTFNSATGQFSNATAYQWHAANVSFTYYNLTSYELSSNRMSTNFTEGIDNVSEKIPTILLIGAVVLLFGVIVLLVAQSKRMGIGGESRGSL